MEKSSCFTAKIDPSLAPKLKEDLEGMGFVLTTPPHTLFMAKKKGVSCTLYSSGTLTVQGKEKDSLIEFYLEPQILHDFSSTYPDLSCRAHIGMDEAGKGDFFGPLCVAALYGSEETIQDLRKMGIRDSKKVSDDRVLAMALKIRQKGAYKLVVLYPETYNRLYAKFGNLNLLLAWAHTKALVELSALTGCKEALLDQFASKELMEKFLKRENQTIVLEQKVRGEADCVVAGASILARAAFLEGMKRLSDEIGLTLPKGASSSVVEMGRYVVAHRGKEALQKLSKVHFKTYGEVCLDHFT